jgi:hypothetical protein
VFQSVTLFTDDVTLEDAAKEDVCGPFKATMRHLHEVLEEEYGILAVVQFGNISDTCPTLQLTCSILMGSHKDVLSPFFEVSGENPCLVWILCSSGLMSIKYLK